MTPPKVSSISDNASYFDPSTSEVCTAPEEVSVCSSEENKKLSFVEDTSIKADNLEGIPNHLDSYQKALPRSWQITEAQPKNPSIFLGAARLLSASLTTFGCGGNPTRPPEPISSPETPDSSESMQSTLTEPASPLQPDTSPKQFLEEKQISLRGHITSGIVPLDRSLLIGGIEWPPGTRLQLDFSGADSVLYATLATEWEHLSVRFPKGTRIRLDGTIFREIVLPKEVVSLSIGNASCSPEDRITLYPLMDDKEEQKDLRVFHCIASSLTKIEGISCRGGVWFHKNGRLRKGRLSSVQTIPGTQLRLPEGALIKRDENGVLKEAIVSAGRNPGGFPVHKTYFFNHSGQVVRIDRWVEGNWSDGLPKPGEIPEPDF